MLRLLPYLGTVLFIVLIAFLGWLAYRYATRHDRLAPKRVLQKQILDHLRHEREVDQLLEELVDTARTSRDTEPLLADSVILKISRFKSWQKQDKELHQ